MKIRRIVPAFLTAAVLLAGCGTGNTVSEESSKKEDPVTGEIFAMDTYMTVTCYGERAEEALEAAKKEISRLDSLLSTGNPESEISRLNENGKGEVSEDTAAIFERALEIYNDTDGAFDITVYPLMNLWGFTDGNNSVPGEESIRRILETCGSGKIIFDRECRQVILGENQGVDLGGIAKGYTSDRLMEIFEEYNLDAGLVSLGGNVECFGTKPDGKLWRCGIQDPLDPSGLAGILEIDSGAVITSGAYERYFTDEQTGEVYHHILDPETGYPAETGLLSVTIVSGEGILADGLSTACYVLGLTDSVHFFQEHGDAFDFIIMTEEKEIYITENLAGRFSSDYPVHVVSAETSV